MGILNGTCPYCWMAEPCGCSKGMKPQTVEQRIEALEREVNKLQREVWKRK